MNIDYFRRKNEENIRCMLWVKNVFMKGEEKRMENIEEVTISDLNNSLNNLKIEETKIIMKHNEISKKLTSTKNEIRSIELELRRRKRRR